MLRLYQKVLVCTEENRSAIKEGVIVELGTTHVRVWDPKSKYDPLPDQAEWFPIKGPKMWIKTID